MKIQAREIYVTPRFGACISEIFCAGTKALPALNFCYSLSYLQLENKYDHWYNIISFNKDFKKHTYPIVASSPMLGASNLEKLNLTKRKQVTRYRLVTFTVHI